MATTEITDTKVVVTEGKHKRVYTRREWERKQEVEQARQERQQSQTGGGEPTTTEQKVGEVFQRSQDWTKHPPTQQEQQRVFSSTGIQWNPWSKTWYEGYRYRTGQPQQQRTPTAEVSVGGEVSKRAVAQLGQDMGLKQGDIGIGVEQTESGSEFKILFYDERSYDSSKVKAEYEKLKSQKLTESKERLREDVFIAETRRMADEGDILAQFVEHVAPRFTQADPLGLRTIGTVYMGRAKRDPNEVIGEAINKINEEALRTIARQFGVSEGRPTTVEDIVAFTLESPVTQVAESIILGEVLGGAIRSFSPLLAPVAEKIPYIGKVGSAVGSAITQHPTLIKAGAWGIWGGAEIMSAKTQFEQGSQIEEITARAGLSAIKMFGFEKSFEHGFQHGLPLKAERILIGKEGTVLYTGLVFETGDDTYFLFGKSPEGWSFGTPKLSEETIKRIYLPSLTSKGGYIPKSPAETKIVRESIISKYPDLEKSLIDKSIELRLKTMGTESAFMSSELPFEEPLKRHGLKDVTITNIKEWLTKQDDILFYGSVGQKAQMEGFQHRPLHDIDLQIKVADATSKGDELLKIIELTEGKGVVWREGTSNLLVSRRGHLFDIHDLADVSASGSGLFSEQYLGFGLKGEPTITIGGLDVHTLSEQSTRKLVSSISLREASVSPAEHRMKDVGDFLNIEDVLIQSQEMKLLSPLKVGDIAIEKELLKDVKDIWIKKDPTIKKALMSNIDDVADDVIYYQKGIKVKSPTVPLDIDIVSISPKISEIEVSSPSIDIYSPSLPSPSPSTSPSISPSVSPSLPSPSPSISPSASASVSPSSPSPSLPSPSISSPSPSSPSPSPSSPSIGSPSFSPPSPPSPPPVIRFPFFDKGKEKKIKKIEIPDLKFGYAPDLGSFLVGRTIKTPMKILKMKTFSGLEKRGIKL